MDNIECALKDIPELLKDVELFIKDAQEAGATLHDINHYISGAFGTLKVLIQSRKHQIEGGESKKLL